MTPRTYETPAAFKQGLEQRLKTSSASGTDFGRRRQLLVFDRFLARVIQVEAEAVILKGGLVLELRLKRARTTKDVDLRIQGSMDKVLERLQEAGRLDLGDFMTFEVRLDDNHPDIQNDGMKYDGIRFRAECRLAGKLYGQVFGVDVAFGDPIIGDPDVVTAEDTLSFAGIVAPTLRLYPVESHIAEKLHAYTMPLTSPIGCDRKHRNISLSFRSSNVRLWRCGSRNGIHRPARLRTRRNSNPRKPKLSPLVRSTILVFSSFTSTCSVANSCLFRFTSALRSHRCRGCESTRTTRSSANLTYSIAVHRS